ncbi:MAG: hypothetical protein K9G41_09675 [Flavobacteriales bacterium]|nr:hypothetical protein [Flavobacteriales bacterium]
MKTVLRLLVAFTFVGAIFGCGNKASDVNTLKTAQTDSLTAEQRQTLNAMIDSITADLQASLISDTLTLLKSVDLNPKSFPSVGDHNISIKWVNSNSVYFIISKVAAIRRIPCNDGFCTTDSINYVTSVTPIDSVNIANNLGVELWLKDGGKGFDTQVYTNPKGYGTTQKMSFSGFSDAKIIPTYQFTGTTSFVGGQDTRDAIAPKTNFITCDLEYNALYRKRVMFWYSNGLLVVSANKNTKALQVKMSACDLDFRYWDSNFQFDPRSDGDCAGVKFLNK